MPRSEVHLTRASDRALVSDFYGWSWQYFGLACCVVACDRLVMAGSHDLLFTFTWSPPQRPLRLRCLAAGNTLAKQKFVFSSFIPRSMPLSGSPSKTHCLSSQIVPTLLVASMKTVPTPQPQSEHRVSGELASPAIILHSAGLLLPPLCGSLCRAWVPYPPFAAHMSG